MSIYVITEVSSGTQFNCRSDQYVLSALQQQGQACVPIGCRGGGCGVCRVQVISGDYECGRMSKAFVTPEQQKQGIALACRLAPKSDLVIECVPSQLVPGRCKPGSKSNPIPNEVI